MKPQYIIDESGKKVSVILSVEDYDHLMDVLDDACCAKLYDQANELNEPFIPLEDYLRDRT
jgi:hypothetical protein